MVAIQIRGTQRFGSGPLVPYIEEFSAVLAREGYAQNTLHAKVRLLIDLSGWLERRKLQVAQLGEDRIPQFMAGRRRRGMVRRGDEATARQLLGYLRSIGCAPAPSVTQDESPLGRIVRDFEGFLIMERGLTRVTLVNYVPVVRRFLRQRFADQRPRFDALALTDVHRFIIAEAQRFSRRRAKLSVTAIRSFLRFLQQRGLVTAELASAVPTLADWRLSHLPKSLSPKEVEQLLAHCDRRTPIGRRDYAILLLLARLGLRAGEVLSMTLEDLDWETGEFLVRGKSQRLERLPLPAEVGAAVAHYLRHVRPRCATRRVFVRMRAPRQGFAGAAAICDVVRRALHRAGLDPQCKGAHLLRHSLATALLRQGASLGEIGQLLRHARPETTQIYAKVDIQALRRIAMPWPGGAS